MYANGERVAKFEGGSLSNVDYYLTDHLGSVVAQVDYTGAVKARNVYRAWGEKLSSSVVGDRENQFQYTGQLLDEELSRDLAYYGKRYYDGGLKIFTSPDPKGYLDPATGGYVYCRNNPMKFVDPTGEYVESPADWQALCVSWDEFDKDPGFWTGAAVVLDAVALGAPFVPAIGGAVIRTTVKAVEGADKAADAAKVAGKADDVAEAAKATEAATDAAQAATKSETHHLLPQQADLKSRFEAVGLNVHDYTVSIDRASHRLKPNGLHTGSNNWNKQWTEYFKKYPNARQEDVLQQLERMKAESGILEE